MMKQKRQTTFNVDSLSFAFLLVSSYPRHNFQLGGNLHSPHQQRLESYSVHADDQLFQRAGGGLTLSLAEKKKGPQERHLFHRLCGGAPQSHLQGISLSAAGVTRQPWSALCLTQTGACSALCMLLVVNISAANRTPFTKLFHCSLTCSTKRNCLSLPYLVQLYCWLFFCMSPKVLYWKYQQAYKVECNAECSATCCHCLKLSNRFKPP